MAEAHGLVRVAPRAQLSEDHRVPFDIKALDDSSKLALRAAVHAEHQEPVQGDALEVQISPSTLQDLPHDLLQARLLHLPGLRFTRRVCKAWRAAYGPLTGGLCLTPADLSTRISPMLAADPHRYAHITSLHLSRPHTEHRQQLHRIRGSTCEAPPLPPPAATAEAFATLIQALPSLLSLSDLHGMAITDPTTLAPEGSVKPLSTLAPQLTALSFSVHDSPPSPFTHVWPSLQALASLRALTIHFRTLAHVQDGTSRALGHLSRLTSLQSLELRHDNHAYYSPRPSSWFTALGALGQLTRLAVGAGLTSWGEPCAATLASGLTRMQELMLPSFQHAEDGEAPAPDGILVSPVVLALAQCVTRLTSLDMDVHGLNGWYGGMRSLASLPRLQRLGVVASRGCERQLEACLAAIAVKGMVTHLSIYCSSYLVDVSSAMEVMLTAACLPHLAALSGCLEELELGTIHIADPGGFMAAVGRLTRLQLLGLRRVELARDHWAPGPEARAELVGRLSLLGGLRVLEVSRWGSELSGGLLRLLGRFTGLRTLALGDEFVNMYTRRRAGIPEPISDAALRQLLLVQHTLRDLELRSCRAVTGPGLAAALPALTCLTSLTLHDMVLVLHPSLLQCLLPLPCSLRRLHLSSRNHRLATGVREGLQAAVDERADCSLHVWEDV